MIEGLKKAKDVLDKYLLDMLGNLENSRCNAKNKYSYLICINHGSRHLSRVGSDICANFIEILVVRERKLATNYERTKIILLEPFVVLCQ